MKLLHRSFLSPLGLLTALIAAAPPVDAVPFTAGNIAVVRVGDGAAALSSAAAAAFIDEYTTAGALVQSIPIPATAAAGTPLTLSGSATSEGGLMRSPNGALLCFAGYKATAGTAGVATTSAATVNRGIGTMDLNGVFALPASTGSQFSGSNIRSAATDAANNYWGGGNGTPAAISGINYFGTVSAAAQLLSGNLRWMNIFNGDLYFSSGSTTPGNGIHQFTGSPVVPAASTPLNVAAGQSPYGFSINPAGTAMYVADDRSTTSGGGIQRWNKAGVVWSLAYTLGTGGGSTVGTRGLAVDWSTATPVLYATTTETLNRLIKITDTGAGSPAATLTTVTANRAFRGVAFAPIQTRVPKPRFFASNLLPPPNGVYLSAPEAQAVYANGVRIRNVSQKGFSRSLPPPPLGGAQTHIFSANTEMDVSNDGGATFQHVSAPTNVTVSVNHTSDAATTSLFDTEMLQLNIAGGGLPPGIMIRESPTRASTGRTTTRPEGGGFMIDSFFDIFTEISLNGGQTWSPAPDPLQVEVSVDPLPVTPIPAPTNLLPSPNDFYASTGPVYAGFGQTVIRNVKHRFFTQSLPAPSLGVSQVQTFDSQFDMEVSQNGGQTFVPVRVPAAASMRVTHSRDEGSTQIFDTEMLQLDLMGGGLPAGVMLRESPTRRSQGGTAIEPLPDGTHRIHSFFDIFTELTVDGGQNWSPAASSPGHVELQCIAPEVVEPTPNLPPPDDQYAGIGAFDMAFASGVILKDTSLSQFTQSQPPPPPGGSQTHTFQAQVKFRISTNNGVTFQPGVAPAQCVVLVRSSTDAGSTRFFDTEMLSLNIEGGTLPAGMRLRESPSKASLGRTSIRMVTDPSGANWDYVSSFFDIFVELTADGGATWQPQVTQPAELVLQKAPKPHFFPTNVLPPPTGVDVSAAGAPFATYANGIIIQNVSHKRPTRGLPPPPPGGTQVHLFGSTVEMDVSNDGGSTFQHLSAPAAVSERVSHVSGDATGNFYDTEMLALNIAGGGLPTGVMVRESPSKASLGRTSLTGTGGGYMIDSFFDIFTEISLDGGQNWSPSAKSAHLELDLDATAIPPIPAPTTLLLPPNDFYTSPASFYALFAQGIVIRNVKHHFFSQSLPAPPLGQSRIQTFDAQMDMEISVDGGQTFGTARAPSALSMRVTHTRDEGTTQIFDTEMLQLDIQGGGLPAGLMLRESPTRRSQGATAIGDPDFDLLRIHSFFDIFTELSLDGGQNWSPASAPSHIELQCNAPEVTETSPNLPSPGGAYASSAELDAAFQPGILVQETRLDNFSQSTPPPPPGGTQIHTFNASLHFMVSVNGGASFTPSSAPAACQMRVTSSQDEGGTRFFDTEMLSLNISGGMLPAGVMLRESPSKASLGRTSIRQIPNNPPMVSSFFDIFTELSLDGGQTWQPSTIAPLGLVLQSIDPDSDDDGLPDAWELAHFGDLTHGPNQDADHDGPNNREEYLAGTSPVNPSSVLRPESKVSGLDLRIIFPTLNGHQYAIESSTDLDGSSWTPVVTGIEGDGTTRSILLTNALSFQRRYYRVIPSLSP